jgi:DNA-binding XRE family transcriptional regulator
MPKIQILYDEYQTPEFAVLKWESFEKLMHKAEQNMNDEDLAEWADIQSKGDKGLPSAVAHLIIDGMNPIKAIRKWRGYKQCELAKLANISAVTLNRIEKEQQAPSYQTLNALATILAVDIKDLMIE